MNKKQYAKKIYNAFGNIDAELLYDAGAYRAPRIKPYLRYIAAAVIVIISLSAALILSAANAVKSYITVDSDYGVMLELNADQRVVKAAASATKYDTAAENCRKLDVTPAVQSIIETMSERGGLGASSNTVLIGVTDDSAPVGEALTESLKSDEYCLICVRIGDEAAAQKLAKKRRITVGKAAFLLYLTEESKDMKENRLFRLSVNDIALLAESKRITAEKIVVSGTPKNGYMTEAQARRIALDASDITPGRVEVVLDTDGFRLIYTVFLYEGNKGAAYFINASTGEVQRVVQGAATSLQNAVERVREEYGTVSENTPPTKTTPISDPVTAESGTTAPTVSAASAQQPTAANSTEQPSATVSTTTPPTASPTELEVTEAPTSPEPQPADTHYLSTSMFNLTPIDIVSYQKIEGRCWSDTHIENELYSQTDPSAVLIRSRDQLLRFWSDHPELQLNSQLQMITRIIEDDGYFDSHALLYATSTEYYEGNYYNFWFASKKGDILYVGLFDTRGIDSIIDEDKQYAIPNSVTHEIELDDGLSEITKIEIVDLTYEQALKMSLVS